MGWGDIVAIVLFIFTVIFLPIVFTNQMCTKNIRLCYKQNMWNNETFKTETGNTMDMPSEFQECYNPFYVHGTSKTSLGDGSCLIGQPPSAAPSTSPSSVPSGTPSAGPVSGPV